MTTPTVSRKQPNIAEISPHLICALCGGYLIDATTIVECLHSFCKTCIVRYLEASKYCPICEVLVHKTRPLQNIKLDHTLQDIVYKLVPGLFQDEMRRRREFYRNSPTIRSAKSRQEQQRSRVIYSPDEKFSVSLEFCPDGKIKTKAPRRGRPSKDKGTERRYLLCPAATTIALLKKFMKLKFGLSEKLKVDIFHANGNVRDHYSLMDVAYIYSWKREGVLQLYYSVYIAPEPIPVIEVTEVKPEDEVKDEDQLEDSRPSSLFSKASSLSNRGVDGDFPHDLSPLELIAHVANDLSCYQEERSLKRKAEEAQLYENDEERSNEIHLQKSIEHAIDLCSNGSITSESSHSLATSSVTLTTHHPEISKNSTHTISSVSQAEVIFTSSQLKVVTKSPITAPFNEHEVKKPIKEKPKTVETASQCDPKMKKLKIDSGSSHLTETHSKAQSVSTKLSSESVHNTDPKVKVESTPMADQMDISNTPSNKVVANNNNNTIIKPNTPNTSCSVSPLTPLKYSNASHSHGDKKTGSAITVQNKSEKNVKPEKNVNVKPEKNVIVKPEKNVNVKPEKTVNVKPEKNINVKSEKNVNVKPEKNINQKPEKNVNLKSEKIVNVKPEKNLNVKPEKNVNVKAEKNVNVKNDDATHGAISNVSQSTKATIRTQSEIPKVQTLESNLTLTNGHKSPDVAKQQTTTSGRSAILDNKE